MKDYQRGFMPYALGAFLIGIVGGFSTLLGPAFVAELGIDYNNTTWTNLAQSISTAACAPVLGKLGDVLGRRKTLLVGVGVFTLGNVFTALARRLWFMLLARFLVGVGTAAMAPVIMAYIVAEFPPEKQAGGFSFYMLLSSASVVAGPTLGSVLIALWGWRGMQWLCVGLCSAVAAGCLALGRGKAPARGPKKDFDGPGAAAVIAFFSLAVCLPTVGQNLGWTGGAFWITAALALAAFGALLAAEKRAKHPILPGWFLRRRSFQLGTAALFLTQGLMQVNMTATLVFTRYTHPEGSLVSGYAVSVLYLGMALGAVALGPLADRREPKKVLFGSFALTGLGCGMLLGFSEGTPPWLLMGALGVLGLGLGGNGTIFMKVMLEGLSPEDAGVGTGTFGLFRDLANPFGVAILLPLFTNRVTALTLQGRSGPAAAVGAMRLLSLVELGMVAAALVAVRLLPRRGSGKE